MVPAENIIDGDGVREKRDFLMNSTYMLVGTRQCH